MKYRIGIDLGGTNIVAGLVKEDYEIAAKLSTPTKRERKADEIVADMVWLVHNLLEENNIKLGDIHSIGLGVPGTANKETNEVEYTNNLNFDKVPIVHLLEKEFQKKVYFDNDGNAAAWGEYLAGAGKGKKCDSLVAVTLGTGVGGGIILNGEIYQGTNFGAAELGHMVIDYKGIPCNCGRWGCLEMYASATALMEQTKHAMKQHTESLLWKLCEQKPESVNGEVLFAAVRQEDRVAKEVLDQYIQYLSIGIANIINLLQPDILCIGGGISNAGDLFFSLLEKHVKEVVYTKDSKKQTKLSIATLNNDAGIIGAAFLKY